MNLTPFLSPDLASYITENTGGIGSPYFWEDEKQGLPVRSEPYIPYLAIVPDYLSYEISGFGLGGAIALNVYTGQVYWGASGSSPVVPSMSLTSGWISSNLGESRSVSAARTARFLSGASVEGVICDVLCIGANHSMGGDTSVELGMGVKVPAKGGSGSTGVMAPVFVLPFTSGDGDDDDDKPSIK